MAGFSFQEYLQPTLYLYPVGTFKRLLLGSIQLLLVIIPGAQKSIFTESQKVSRSLCVENGCRKVFVKCCISSYCLQMRKLSCQERVPKIEKQVNTAIEKDRTVIIADICLET